MRRQLVAVAVEVGDQPVEEDHGESARGRDGQPLSRRRNRHLHLAILFGQRLRESRTPSSDVIHAITIHGGKLL